MDINDMQGDISKLNKIIKSYREGKEFKSASQSKDIKSTSPVLISSDDNSNLQNSNNSLKRKHAYSSQDIPKTLPNETISVTSNFALSTSGFGELIHLLTPVFLTFKSEDREFILLACRENDVVTVISYIENYLHDTQEMYILFS